jgi:hypothetical protein
MARNLEASIGGLPGVRRVKAVVGPEGLEGLRVLVIPERSTTKTMNEVKKIVSSQVPDPVDQARIQVIRTAPTRSTRRRRLSMLSLDHTDRTFSVRAALELSGDVLMGESSSAAGRYFERKTVANAILNGSEELIGFPIEVERINILTDGDAQVAVVILSRADEVLVGSAVLRNGEQDAIARATLDAINRFIAPATDEDEVEG